MKINEYDRLLGYLDTRAIDDNHDYVGVDLNDEHFVANLAKIPVTATKEDFTPENCPVYLLQNYTWSSGSGDLIRIKKKDLAEKVLESIFIKINEDKSRGKAKAA